MDDLHATLGLTSNIVVLDIPPIASRTPLKQIWPLFIVVIVGISAPFLIVFAVIPLGTRNPLILLGVISAYVILALVVFLWVWRRNKFLVTKLWSKFGESQDRAPFAKLLDRAIGPRHFYSLSIQNADAVAALNAIREAIPNRIAFVVPSIAAKLIQHQSPPGLLEPEEIGHAFSIQQACVVTVPLLYFTLNNLSEWATGRKSMTLLIFGLLPVAISFLFALVWWVSVLGERFMPLKTTRGIVRAGPGWIDARDGRRWTIEDSVLIIREQYPAKNPNYSATLLGATGSITLPIGKGGDPAFVNLWQRWTTQFPRIDLMPERRMDPPISIRGALRARFLHTLTLCSRMTRPWYSRGSTRR